MFLSLANGQPTQGPLGSGTNGIYEDYTTFDTKWPSHRNPATGVNDAAKGP